MTIIAEGQVIAEKIRLERPLARGGMGSVWIAHHLKLDAPVAVKFMAPQLAASETARARFEREARASAQLRSPHVVQVHDYGVEGETPYIVMELLHGEDLATRLGKRKRLGLAEATHIAAPITKALRRAHELGLVHRDLKPANVFLARAHEGAGEDDEVVKLLDFGIAKTILPGTLEAGDVTRSGNLVGSPLYMSPEQIRKSKEVDHRSDLWSLAVILYEMLTGRPPFVEDEVGAVLVAICTDPIEKPSSLVPSLGPSVDRFFETALARDPAKRFQSAKEMFDAITALSAANEAEPSRTLAMSESTKVRSPIALADTAASADEPKAEHEKSKALGHAETVPLAGPSGTLTLSPSGRTRDATKTIEKGAPRLALLAAAMLGIVALFAFVFGRGTAPEPQGDDKDPGSPTLPLPPPTAEPVAVAIPDKPDPEKLAPVEPKKADEATLAASPKPLSTARADKQDKPAATAKGATKPAGTAQGAGAAAGANDDDELGLEKPKATTPTQ